MGDGDSSSEDDDYKPSKNEIKEAENDERKQKRQKGLQGEAIALAKVFV